MFRTISAARSTPSRIGADSPGCTSGGNPLTCPTTHVTSMPARSFSSRKRFDVGIWCMEKSSSLISGSSSAPMGQTSPGSRPMSTASTTTTRRGRRGPSNTSKSTVRTEVPTSIAHIPGGAGCISPRRCATAGPKPSSPKSLLPHPSTSVRQTQ
jgi:hypothetical protein